jgi:hypothetical protein
MWEWGELSISGMENGRLGLYVLALGQDESGEIYVMTNTSSGPLGDGGQVWKLVPAMESSDDGGEAAPEATMEAGGDSGEAAPAEPETTASP